MQALHAELEHRFPHWFRGRRARLVQPVLRAAGRWSRLDEVAGFLARNDHLRDFVFVDAALEHLQARQRIDDADLARIPASGRLLIVANHPSGALDALALLQAVGRVRRDVRIVANDMLLALTPLAGLLLPVRVIGGKPAPAHVAAIGAELGRERCVIVFPAGEVSRLTPRGVRDGRWRAGFVRFARRTAAPVLPVRIAARNSALFYGASTLFKPVGSALLAREMFARRKRPITLHVGTPLRLADEEDTGSAIRRVRQALYALGGARSPVPRDASAACPEPVAGPEDPRAVAAQVADCRLLGHTGDGKQIVLAMLAHDGPLRRELGRLRELTFRAVGEGSGRARDLDRFDAHYEHILLWDAAARRIVGGYRVMRGAQALARSGLDGLYTASLFRFADDAIPRIAQGLELGRSFVAQDYWGSRSLDYLWQGIGCYLQAHRGVRYLFGPVSISAALPPAAREQLVAYYAHFHGSGDHLADSRRPFEYQVAPPSFTGIDPDTAFAVLRASLAALGAQVPTLYKQYTELCEPGGARFLAFGTDPDFSDAIDGLIEVDLDRMRPHKRRRYLRAEAAA